jgi:hypothetical protein
MDDISATMSARRLKAFLIECSEPSWVEIAQHLRVAGIDVTYWVAWARIQDEIEKACPTALFHSTIDAKRGIPLAQFHDAISSPFTPECSVVWEKGAQTVYEMMIRFDHGRDLIHTEASALFYQLLLYWNTVLDRMRPDVVIFPTPPHVVYDYVILSLCQQKKIPTLLFEQAWIFPPYSMSMWDFREGSVALRERYAQVKAGPKPVPLSARGREIIDRLSGQYAEARAPSEVTFSRTARHDLDDETFWAEERRFFEANVELEKRWHDQYAVRGWRGYWQRRKQINPVAYEKQVNVDSLAKQRGESLASSFEGLAPNQHYLEQRMVHLRITRERYIDYQAKASRPRWGEKFIFLPLMFQPERTSCPQGGIFSNQQIMVNLLSSLAPKGTWIYVKEHPTQLHPNMQSTQARSADFYTTLSNFSNVRLIDIDTDPFLLIDRCVAVATIGGTAAIEAVTRGKPALVFGHAYYNDCSGIHPIASDNDLRRALTEIAANPAVDRADVEAYFHAIETSLFVGNADANIATYEVEGNAKNIADEIVRRVSEKYPASALRG